MKGCRLIVIAILFLLISCKSKDNRHVTLQKRSIIHHQEPVIIDCAYTFEQATEGSVAPDYVVDLLRLIEVKYYSFDGKLHQGQLLVNRNIVKEVQEVFNYIKCQHFPLKQVVPIVKYHWNDELSMNDNNTYCFCYRDVAYSKHAYGLAIDINPMQNPVRWKGEYRLYRRDKPIGAVYNPMVPGTFSINSKVVHEFRIRRFRWGHSFTAKFDDHHFEKY
jgi:peptidoglycan LD-endopeptidase CwlK